MNNLWHFGSSYGTCGPIETIFSHHIAEHYNLKFNHLVVQGCSNFMIFSDILSNESKFKKNDFILINWTYLSRGEYIDKNNQLRSTNIFIKEKNKELLNPPDENELNLDWILNWSYDWNVKFFKYTVSKYFFNLKMRGINIYNVWFYDDPLYQNGIKKMMSVSDCNIFGILDFSPNYYTWLENMKWLKENPNEYGGGHYKNNIQIELSKEYIRRIEDLNKKIL